MNRAISHKRQFKTPDGPIGGYSSKKTVAQIANLQEHIKNAQSLFQQMKEMWR